MSCKKFPKRQRTTTRCFNNNFSFFLQSEPSCLGAGGWTQGYGVAFHLCLHLLCRHPFSTIRVFSAPKQNPRPPRHQYPWKNTKGKPHTVRCKVTGDNRMKRPSAEKPNYGNWVSMRFIYVPGVVGLIFIGLAIIFPFLVVVAALFLFVSLYFAYARYLFSPQGRNLQDQVRWLVVSNLDWNGEGQILDIGCGSGSLTIALAKK